MKTTLFLPVLNEIDGLEAVMPRINRDWVDEIVAVDGGSTDGSLELLRDLGIRIVHQRSRGICGAYWECYEVAQGEVIIAFSPDNNSLPEKIPELVARIRAGYDMAIVSRYLPGAQSEDDDLVTAFGNRMFTQMVNTLFGGRYSDVLVMFRAFRKALPFELELTDRTRPVHELELCIRCAKQGRRVTEIPGDEPPRLGGERKMRPLYNGSMLLRSIGKELVLR